MTATKLHFDNQETPHCEQGATFEFSFNWEDSEGTAVDLSFYTAKMQVRKNYGGPLIIELSTENGRIIIDSNSQVTLFIPAEITQLLPAGKYVYDLKITDTDLDKIYRLLEGEFFVSPEVTI